MYKHKKIMALLVTVLLSVNLFSGVYAVGAAEVVVKTQEFVPEEDLPDTEIGYVQTAQDEKEQEEEYQSEDTEEELSQEMINQFNNNNFYHHFSPEEFEERASLEESADSTGAETANEAQTESSAALAANDSAEWDSYQPNLGLSPYNFSFGNENVSLTTGDLSYNANIVSLKGRNGLDLYLAMQYSTGGAEASPGDFKREYDNDIETSPGGLSSDVYFETKDPRYMGVGWSLSLPYISVRAPWYANTRHPEEYVIHLPGIGSYEIEDDLKLRNYKLNDLTLQREGENFVLTYKNGMRDYFDASQGYLVKRQDRYGNEINFGYTEMESGVINYLYFTKYLLSSVTSDMFDTVNIDYQYGTVSQGKYIQKISFKQNDTVLGIVNLGTQESLINPANPVPCVQEIIDGEGRKTEFVYETKKFFHEANGATDASGTKFNLKRITYPTGNYTEYIYRNAQKQYINGGNFRTYSIITTKLAAREDFAPGETEGVNRIEYAYQGDATGAPYYYYDCDDRKVVESNYNDYQEAESYFYHTTVSQMDGDSCVSKKVYTFDQNGNKVKDAEISAPSSSGMDYYPSDASHILTEEYGYFLSEDNRYLIKQNLHTGEKETVCDFENYDRKQLMVTDSIYVYIFSLQSADSFYKYNREQNTMDMVEMDSFYYNTDASVVYHQGILYIGGERGEKFYLFKFDANAGTWMMADKNNIDTIEMFSTRQLNNAVQYCGASGGQLFYCFQNRIYAVNLETKGVKISTEKITFKKSYETKDEIGFVQSDGLVKKIFQSERGLFG